MVIKVKKQKAQKSVTSKQNLNFNIIKTVQLLKLKTKLMIYKKNKIHEFYFPEFVKSKVILKME